MDLPKQYVVVVEQPGKAQPRVQGVYSNITAARRRRDAIFAKEGKPTEIRELKEGEVT